MHLPTYEPTKLRFIKIKFDGSEMLLQYERLNGNGEWDEYSMKSRQEPHTDFIGALRNLDAVQVDMCELVDDDLCDEDSPYLERERTRHEVRGLSLSYSKDDADETVTGYTVTSMRRLNHANSPVSINSPHKFDRPHNEHGESDILMEEEHIDEINKVCQEALNYMSGKRKQMDMFAEEQEAV